MARDPVDLAEAAFEDRFTSDAAMASLLGASGEAPIERGWPTDILEDPVEAAFPIVTYFGLPRGMIDAGIGEARIQVDVFTWEDAELLADVTEQLIARFYKQKWRFGGDTFRVRHQVTGRDEATGGRVSRRMREFIVGVN